MNHGHRDREPHKRFLDILIALLLLKGTIRMKNIYLVRHGESIANVDQAIYKTTADHAIPLSDIGKRQATAAGQALLSLLTIDPATKLRIWISPYLRTRETGALIEAQLRTKFTNLDKREHVNLCEQQFGLFDGVRDEALALRFPAEHAHYALAEQHEGKFWARMPLGESRFDVAVRIHQAFGTFHRDAERRGVENIIVVCHGVTLRAFAMQWLHLPYEWFDQQANPGNCDIYHLGNGEGRYLYQGGTIL